MDLAELARRMREAAIGNVASESEDAATRDAAGRWARETCESVGLDLDEVMDVASDFTKDTSDKVGQLLAKGMTPDEAVTHAHMSALIMSVMLGALAHAGIVPAAAEGMTYEEHPDVSVGGWISERGDLVRVLGVDAIGTVAMERDGVLVSAHQRFAPAEFLRRFTRVDDVPIIGGER
jgi:hypothetical protein